MPARKTKTKIAEYMAPTIQLPKHVEEAIRDAMAGLEHFVPEENLRRLLISDPKHKKVAKLGADEEIAWILGYLRGITDTLRLEPDAVWWAFQTPREAWARQVKQLNKEPRR
jgi:hypothetical protein